MRHHKHSVAILIDGGFFIKRYTAILDKTNVHTPEQAARNLCTFAMRHVRENNHLYRIFYYDCMPFDKKIHNPVTKKVIDFKKTLQYQFRIQLFEELKKKRKMALRPGEVRD